MKWIIKDPEYGDIIRTKVTFYHHYGIFVSDRRVIQFGLPNDVGRPADEVKVLESDIYAFLQGGELEVAKLDRSEAARRRSPKETVAFAETKIGQGGYDILHNNCEHFVNLCVFGESKSAFLQDVREKLRHKLGK